MILPDIPFRIEFEVTSVCNLNCVYCYAQPFSGISPPIERLEYLFAKTKREANPFEMVLVGGEPFTRKDMIDVIGAANRIFNRGMEVSTNGTLLSTLSSDKLDMLRVNVRNGGVLQVSIDSVNAVINSRTRGKTEATISGLDTLEKGHIPFSVGTVLTSANLEDVKGTYRHLLTRYGYLNTLNLEPLQPTLSLGKDYYRLRLDRENMTKAYDDVIKAVSESKRSDVKIVGFSDDCADKRDQQELLVDSYRLKTCTAGLLRAAVFADGNVSPCALLRGSSIGNLYKESWKEIWRNSRIRIEKIGGIGMQCNLNLLRNNIVTKEKVKGA